MHSRFEVFGTCLVVALCTIASTWGFVGNHFYVSPANPVVSDSLLVKAPQFTLPNLEDTLVSLADYEGKFLVIHIATTWCPYCNVEAPHLEELHRKYESDDVEVMIIDVKEPKEIVKSQIADRFELTFPVLLDHDGSVAASFAPPDVLPELARDDLMLAANIIVGPEGHIRYMTLLDTKNFDSKLILLKKELDEFLING